MNRKPQEQNEEREVALDEVLKAFLEAERHRPRYDPLRTLFAHDEGALWSIMHNIATTESLHVLRRAIENPSALEAHQLSTAVRMLGEYANVRIPLVPFTVGSSRDDRTHNVRKWVLRKGVAVGEFWIPYLNAETKGALEASQFNLADAAAHFPEEHWRPSEDSSAPVHPVICIQDANGPSDGHKGHLQVLDGAHRIVGLKKAGRDDVSAYVGVGGQ